MMDAPTLHPTPEELVAVRDRVQAVLPDGWAVSEVSYQMLIKRYQAKVELRSDPVLDWNHIRTVTAEGSTLAAALDALVDAADRMGRASG